MRRYKTEGRKVGKLVQVERDGMMFWEPEVILPGARVSANDFATFVVENFRTGMTRSQITVAAAEAFDYHGKSATLYRRVDQILLDADIRKREEASRVSSRRDVTGEASLPSDLPREF